MHTENVGSIVFTRNVSKAEETRCDGFSDKMIGEGDVAFVQSGMRN